MKRRVAVIGGGLAGIAAAIRLIEADHQPIVIETRKKLGGRATSFDDARTGQTLDNCQHVLMGCCTNLIDLYDRLSVLDLIEWHRELYWTDGGGNIDTVRASRLPAPLHLARSFGRLSVYTVEERKAIRAGMWKLIRLGRSRSQRLVGKTFRNWLDSIGQPASAIERFWNHVIVSACNLDVDRVDARCAVKVFQDGFLGDKWAYAMGVPAVPLGALYKSARKIIEQGGGEIQLGASAQRINYSGDRVSGVVTSQGMVDASAVIATVPPDRLQRLCGDALRQADRRLTGLDQITFSPILGVHLQFEQAVMDLPHLTLVGMGVQWLFNKGVDDAGAQHVHAVISAADGWMALDEQEIVDRVVADIHRALPHSVGLQPITARAVKEKRATFAATPQAWANRPSTAPGYVGVHGGGVENLFLAGDWTDTGWPATMEGAVRSGYEAAADVSGMGGVIEDLPTAWLPRLLGLR